MAHVQPYGRNFVRELLPLLCREYAVCVGGGMKFPRYIEYRHAKRGDMLLPFRHPVFHAVNAAHRKSHAGEAFEIPGHLTDDLCSGMRHLFAVKTGKRRVQHAEDEDLPGHKRQHEADSQAYGGISGGNLLPGECKEVQQKGEQQAFSQRNTEKEQRLPAGGVGQKGGNARLVERHEDMSADDAVSSRYRADGPESVVRGEFLDHAEDRFCIGRSCQCSRSVRLPLVNDVAGGVGDGNIFRFRSGMVKGKETFHGLRPQTLAHAHEQAEMVRNILTDQTVYLKHRFLVLLVERGKHERSVQQLRAEQSENTAGKESEKGSPAHQRTAGICW